MLPTSAENPRGSELTCESHVVFGAPGNDKKQMQTEANDGHGVTDARASRRTPQVSLIVVLPENHVVTSGSLVERLRAYRDHEVHVVVACAGQPTNLVALQRTIGDAQFLLAPSGTSAQDLRELAMRQVPGDVVTLLSGAPVSEPGCGAAELLMTS